MRDRVLDIIERDSLSHTARRYGWMVTWRADGLVDLARGEVSHLGVLRREAYALIMVREG